MDRFQYEPLTEPDSFRLILLQPSPNSSSPLHCTLQYTTISKYDREIIDHYTALSYVWGNPSSKRGVIAIDGTEVGIGASLEAALRDLRDSKRVLHIWADALCIDQSNLGERASQVGLMGEIYSTAHHTVIHLGPSEAGASILSAIPSNTLGTITYWDQDGLVASAETSLLRMPWFSRVWIFQELLLSKDPWVQCGGVRARWNQLCGSLLQGNRSRSKELQVLADMNGAISVHKQKLFVHLLARRGLGATDPRDMIFAHIGIAVDAEELNRYVQVNYNRSCGEIYNDTAKYLLDTVGPETLFRHATDVELESKVEGLASWASDWSLPSSGLASIYRNSTLTMQNLNSQEKHYVLLDFDSRPMLAYLGYEVDRIQTLSLPLPEPKALSLETVERTEYEDVMKELMDFYHTGSGVWWSGDEDGQHRHFNFTGKEDWHRERNRVIHDEWVKAIGEELPLLLSMSTPEEMELHKNFMEIFKSWVKGRENEQIIMTGQDSDGIESLMWRHLLQHYNRGSALTGRRLAFTRLENYLGVVPLHTQVGDRAVFLGGSPVAYVVRPTEQSELSTDDNWRLQSEVKRYVDGRLEVKNRLERTVIHCTLVGECYIEGVVGWTKGKVPKTIYALS